MLAVTSTHPIQYHAPVYRALQQQCGISVTAIYGSDFSVVGYRDAGFNTTFAWDTDLLSGYHSHFLGKVADGGAGSAEAVTGRGLEEALAKVKPDAILLTGYMSTFNRRAFSAAQRLRIPILFRAETSDYALQRHPLKRWSRDIYLRWFYRHCTVLLPIGQHSVMHYRRLAPNKPMIMSPYCVDVSPFQPAEADREALRTPTRASLGISEQQIAVLVVGKLYEAKAPDLVLQAVRAMTPELRESLVILFLGDGTMRSSLESEASAHPTVETRFLGFQNQTQLSRYYHASDLMVLPSRYGETWGLVTNEALHHGVPVVASDAVGSAIDLVIPNKTGEIFRNQDALGLRDAIKRAIPLVGDPTVRALCRSQVATFSVTAAAQGIAAGFEMSLAHHPRGHNP